MQGCQEQALVPVGPGAKIQILAWGTLENAIHVLRRKLNFLWQVQVFVSFSPIVVKWEPGTNCLTCPPLLAGLSIWSARTL